MPLRWSGCSSVTWSADPAGWQRDLAGAWAQLAAATGLRLREASGPADLTVPWDPALCDPAVDGSGEAGVTTTGVATTAIGRGAPVAALHGPASCGVRSGS